MDYAKASMELHREHGGKVQTHVPFKLETAEDLAVAYTPGVAAPCRAIAENPEEVWNLTPKGHTVAVVTDGSSVLGLGNIGPEAGLPVMGGKAALFKTLANVDAVPLALATQDPKEIVETIVRIAPSFGGINLEDIAAPACFEVERALIEQLDIPVMHDDQHGTAIVVTAGLMNAVKVVGKAIDQIDVVINGAGAAGLAIAHMLNAAGVQSITVCDSRGAMFTGRENLNPYKEEVLSYNTKNKQGSLADVLVGADVFVGVSKGNLVDKAMVQSMAEGSIVMAMANPDPEILPSLAKEAGAAVVATGRSDFENQINNVLAFPGIFKGALEARVKEITMEMKLAAARAIATAVEQPEAGNIMPSATDRSVAERVSQAIQQAAQS